MYENLIAGDWMWRSAVAKDSRTLRNQRMVVKTEAGATQNPKIVKRPETSMTDRLRGFILGGPDTERITALRRLLQDTSENSYRSYQTRVCEIDLSSSCQLTLDALRRMRPNVTMRSHRVLLGLARNSEDLLPTWMLNMNGKGAYASDEIVNTFFKLFSRRTIDLSTENPTRTWPRCQYMSSLFMEKVMDLSKSEQPGRGEWPTYYTGKNGITRWRPEVSPLEFDFIFFPINVDSNHWILAVVAVSSEEVRIYDPLPGGEYMDYGRTILRYLT